jgi:hypothetical protein
MTPLGEERLPEEQEPGVRGMEPVHVLRRIDRSQHRRLVHVIRQRELHEDPVDGVVRVQVRDELEDLALGRIGGKAVVPRVDPCLLGRLVLRADVRVRGGIVADEDRGEADGAAPGAHILRDLRPDLERQLLAVDAGRGHGATLLTGVAW